MITGEDVLYVNIIHIFRRMEFCYFFLLLNYIKYNADNEMYWLVFASVPFENRFVSTLINTKRFHLEIY